jgi:hypothetical protein
MKADFAAWERFGRLHQLADGTNDLDELFVVLTDAALELVQPGGKFAVTARIFRSRTKARMISRLTRTARSLRSTLESMATPCSVKA